MYLWSSYTHTSLPYSGLFSRGNISQMPCGVIIHEEKFHECMDLNNIAILNSANLHRKNFPSKITRYTVSILNATCALIHTYVPLVKFQVVFISIKNTLAVKNCSSQNYG